MPKRSSTRARDLNQLAAAIVDAATEGPAPSELRMHAQALGRQGGLKGGPARAERLTPEERSAIARKAARARWAARKTE